MAGGLLMLTASSANVKRPPFRIALEAMQEQEAAKKEFLFWQSGVRLAAVWSSAWALPPYWPHLTCLGVDLCAVVHQGTDSTSQCRLAATCRSLRGLLLERLQTMKMRALRRLYMSGALI